MKRTPDWEPDENIGCILHYAEHSWYALTELRHRDGTRPPATTNMTRPYYLVSKFEFITAHKLHKFHIAPPLGCVKRLARHSQ